MGSRNIMDGGARGVNSDGERATGKEKSGERPAGRPGEIERGTR
jgi:hypothetical protein